MRKVIKQKLQASLFSPCPYCNRPYHDAGRYVTMQHVLPKRRGGQNTLENCRPACYQCNQDLAVDNIDDCPAALACYRDINPSWDIRMGTLFAIAKTQHIPLHKNILYEANVDKLLRPLIKPPVMRVKTKPEKVFIMLLIVLAYGLNQSIAMN